jgi:hypothetical protein
MADRAPGDWKYLSAAMSHGLSKRGERGVPLPPSQRDGVPVPTHKVCRCQNTEHDFAQRHEGKKGKKKGHKQLQVEGGEVSFYT